MYMKSSLLLCIGLILYSGAMQAQDEDERLIISKGERASVRFMLPEPASSYDLTTFLLDTTVTLYGDGWEVSLNQSGTIFQKQANMHYESRVLAAACGQGRAYSSTGLAEMLFDVGMTVNQVPIKVNCLFDACLTTGMSFEGEKKIFTFSLHHPFYTFSGSGPWEMRNDLISTLYSFRMYNLDPELLEPDDRKVPTKVLEFGEKVLEEVARVPIEAGIEEEDTPQAMPDFGGEQPYSLTLYNDAIFEPDPQSYQPGGINYNKLDWIGEDELIIEEPPTITITIDGETYDGSQPFYAEPGETIEVTYEMLDRKKPVILEMVIPESEGLVEVPSKTTGAASNTSMTVAFTSGLCACTGSTLWDINALIRFPLDPDKLDAQLRQFEKRCEAEPPSFEEWELRKTVLKNLQAQIGNLGVFVENILRKNDSLISANQGKVEDYQKAIEQYEASLKEEAAHAATTAQISQLRTSASQKLDQVRNLRLKISRYYDKLSDVAGAINRYNAFLETVKGESPAKSVVWGLPSIRTLEPLDVERDANRATLQARLGKVKTLKTEFEAALQRNEEDYDRTSKELDKLRNDHYHERDEKKRENLQIKIKIAEERLEVLSSRSTPLKMGINRLRDLIEKFEQAMAQVDELETLQSFVEQHQTADRELHNLRDRLAKLLFRKQAAEVYIEDLKKLKEAAEKDVKEIERFATQLDSIKQEFEGKHRPAVKGFERRLYELAKGPGLNVEMRMGADRKYVPSRESSKPLKSALKTLGRFGTDEYWRFREIDVVNAGAAYVEGFVTGMNPFELVEMAQYVAVLVGLHLYDERAAREELQKISGQGAAFVDHFFNQANFAEQIKVIAQIAGNARGELALGALSTKAGKLGYQKARAKYDELMESRARALKNINSKAWPRQSRNDVMNDLLYQIKKVDVEYWHRAREALDDKIKKNEALQKDKLNPEKFAELQAAGEILREVINPVDLYRINTPEFADAGFRNMLRKLQKAVDKRTKGGKEPIYWQAFYVLKDLDPNLAGRMDVARDELIYSHLRKIQEVGDELGELEFWAGYSGSAKGVLPKNPDWTKIAGDRDLLFLGPDGPIAMRRFIESIEADLGPAWGRILDSDAYLDSQFDDINRLGLTPQELEKLPFYQRKKIAKHLEDHRTILNKELDARYQKYRNEALGGEAEKVDIKELTPEQLNAKLSEMQLHFSEWQSSKNPEALRKYLELNRDYFLAQKDAYLTPGSRKLEIELRMDWASEKHKLESGDDWSAYMDQLHNGNLKSEWKDIPLGETRDGLENITENLAQAYNKQRKVGGDMLKVAHETAKYYERAMRSGVVVKPQIDLTSIPASSGKSIEDLRRVAMKIKELKDVNKTRVLIADYYGVDYKKTDNALFDRFQKDCEVAVANVQGELQKAMPTE